MHDSNIKYYEANKWDRKELLEAKVQLPEREFQ